MSRKIVTYIRLSEEERRKIECVQKILGHKYLTDTLRTLITLGMLQIADKYKHTCLDRLA